MLGASTTSKDAHSSSSGSEKLTQPSLALRQTEGIRSSAKPGNVITSSKFESVDVRPVAADDGRLVRSSEEWDLGPASDENVEIVGDIKKHGEDFSEKFDQIGSHRNSLTGNNTSPPGRPLVEPKLPLPTERDDYDSRLGNLQHKLGSSTTEERLQTLLRSTAGIITPPNVRAELQNLSTPQSMTPIGEKSQTNLSSLAETSAPQSFERVSSVAGLERSAHSVNENTVSYLNV